MATHVDDKLWDFSPIYDLLSALSHKTSATDRDIRPLTTQDFESSAVSTRGRGEVRSPSPTLGNFNKVWQFLGTPQESPAPIVPQDVSPKLDQLAGWADYTSDGAIYRPPSTKGVKWRDEEYGADLEDTAEDTVVATPLTKTQRKKLRRKERAQREGQTLPTKSASDLESETEEQHARNAPARKASTHTIAPDPELGKRRYNLRPRDENGQVRSPPGTPMAPESIFGNSFMLSPKLSPQSKLESQNLSQPTVQSAGHVLQKQKTTTTPSTPINSHKRDAFDAKHSDDLEFDQLDGLTSSLRTTSTSETAERAQPAQAIHNSLKKHYQVANPYSIHAFSTFSSPIQAPQNGVVNQVSFSGHIPKYQSLQDQQKQVSPTHNQPTEFQPMQLPRASRPTAIQPLKLRSGEDRNLALLLKLIHNFGEDMKYLVNPMNLSNHNNDPRGIHVFVDASNIFIGFHDQLKRARNIPLKARVPLANLSFHSLALLMERRRPVAKRVLAGSKPHIPEFDLAAEIGYELCIMDRVYKAKVLTERQKFFQAMDAHKRSSYAKSGFPPPSRNRACFRNKVAADGSGSSGSETMGQATAPVYTEEKWVEQGVDEILHLKILESIVDTEMPSTVVLATGDAAEAEYSQGFMRMVERALTKGWKVELVSWSKNISGAYKRQDFLRQWGDRFRIIELDDYAEELLDM
ncbi:hypothetical protein B0A49_03190 [Cryomyces minteri]|uniref:NYN domain-containing protein n=1 Tax=Cryomyces minteri TaxID=331657 RepID=A0A4U0XVR8_9PEZI|nr:hypothetical protein B0A49_03190 [Cryomyces minteri]